VINVMLEKRIVVMPKEKVKKEETKPKEVPLVDRIPVKNARIDDLAMFCDEQLKNLQLDRNRWLVNRKAYIRDVDNFINYGRKKPFEDASDLHIPVTLEKQRATHAKLVQAVDAMRPRFWVEPQEKLDRVRLYTIHQLLRWATTRFVNYYRGISEAIDDWLWRIAGEGWNVLRLRWDTVQRKSIVLEDQEAEVVSDDVEGKAKLKEVEKWLDVFSGPVVESIDNTDIYFGGRGDFHRLPFVGISTWISESKLKLYKVTKFFDAKATEEVLKLPDRQEDDYDGGASDLKRQEDINSGVDSVDSIAKKKLRQFNIFECQVSFDIDGDGFDEELVVWYHKRSRQVVRWTYLDRIVKTGRRPLYKADYIRRPSRNYSIGLLELLHSLNQEVNAIHNQRIDYGTLSNLPFFFYDPGSSMPHETIQVKPGQGIPLTSPKESIYWPTIGNTTAWGFQEESLLFDIISRVSSISELDVGLPVSPAEGTRTQGGMAALLNEGNSQLDVTLRRIQEQLSLLYGDIHQMLIDRLPKGFQYLVVGDDGTADVDDTGQPRFNTLSEPRKQISGRVHFHIQANSRAGNREMARQLAIQEAQLLLTPVNVESGIVSVNNIYEINKGILELGGELDIDKKLTRPADAEPPISVADEINSLKQGIMPRIILNDNHQQKVQVLTAFRTSPMFMTGIETGTIDKNALVLFEEAIRKHGQFAAQIASMQQLSQQNQTGMQMQPQLTGAPPKEEQTPETEQEVGNVEVQ
jgi:hypothetical protein